MEVLIILGKNKKGKKEAVEEDHISWMEAIERSPVGEFVVRDKNLYYRFLLSDNLPGVLTCSILDQQGNKVGFFISNRAVVEFDRLLSKFS